MCLIVLFLALWRKIIVCPLSKLKFLCTKKLFCEILVDAQINFLSKIVIDENRKLSWSRFSTSWRKNMLSRKDLFFCQIKLLLRKNMTENLPKMSQNWLCYLLLLFVQQHSAGKYSWSLLAKYIKYPWYLIENI